MTQPLTDAEREEARRIAQDCVRGGHFTVPKYEVLARAVLALDGENGWLRDKNRVEVDAYVASEQELRKRVAELEAEVEELRRVRDMLNEADDAFGKVMDERDAARVRVVELEAEVESRQFQADGRLIMENVEGAKRLAELEAEVARLRENQYAVYDGAKREWDGIAADLRARAEAAEARVRELEAELSRFLHDRESTARDEYLAKLKARAERLERAVREAPHESGCNVRARHAPDGKQTVWTSDGWTEITRYRCDCWKAKALEDSGA